MPHVPQVGGHDGEVMRVQRRVRLKPLFGLDKRPVFVIVNTNFSVFQGHPDGLEGDGIYGVEFLGIGFLEVLGFYGGDVGAGGGGFADGGVTTVGVWSGSAEPLVQGSIRTERVVGFSNDGKPCVSVPTI